MKAPSSCAVAHSGSKLGSSRFLPMMLEANIEPLRPSLVMARLSSSAARWRILHRQRGDADEAVRMGGDVLRHLVVLDRGEHGARAPVPDCRDRSAAWPRARARRRRSRPCPAAGAGYRSRRSGTAGRPAADVERRVLAIDRRDGHLHPGLGEQRGGFQGQNVGVGVDRPQLEPFRPLKLCFCGGWEVSECRTRTAGASPCCNPNFGL